MNHKMARNIRFNQIVSLADQIADQLQGLKFGSFQPLSATWQPAVNVYAYDGRLEVCVDLAGVAKQEITVEVEPHRLVVRGYRKAPGHALPEGCSRLLVMEIQDGAFERVLTLGVAVDPEQVSARQDNGWLWISLPKMEKEGSHE